MKIQGKKELELSGVQKGNLGAVPKFLLPIKTENIREKELISQIPVCVSKGNVGRTRSQCR